MEALNVLRLPFCAVREPTRRQLCNGGAIGRIDAFTDGKGGRVCALREAKGVKGGRRWRI
jgi:hypothetical protein